MVKIRLMRAGAKKHPYYRIVAIDERKKRDGRPLEYLGTYDPNINPIGLTLKLNRVEAWQSKGAQLTETVQSLVRKMRRAAPAEAVAESA